MKVVSEIEGDDEAFHTEERIRFCFKSVLKN